MANHSAAINTKTAENILAEIDIMKKALEGLRKKVLQALPAKYGSDLWWEKEIQEGVEEIRQGKYTVYENVKELISDLHAGK